MSNVDPQTHKAAILIAVTGAVAALLLVVGGLVYRAVVYDGPTTDVLSQFGLYLIFIIGALLLGTPLMMQIAQALGIRISITRVTPPTPVAAPDPTPLPNAPVPAPAPTPIPNAPVPAPEPDPLGGLQGAA